MIGPLDVRKRKIIKIVIILLSLFLLYVLFVYLGRRMVEAQIASRYHEMDTFTEEDEEILRKYFNITPIDNMELDFARFVGVRDYIITIWYVVKDDINNLLEINPNYVLSSDNTSILSYKPYEDKMGTEYYWEEGSRYLGIYKKNDYYIATFYTKYTQEGILDIIEQVFLKEPTE